MRAIFLLIVYLILAAFLYPLFKYYIDSADTLQYITIAKNYSEGYFPGAINSFWSPMISWLLVPFIFMRTEPVFAFKILQILIGLFTLRLIFYHIEQTHSEKFIKTILGAASVLLVLSFAFLFSTPDLLLLTLYLWFVKLLKNRRSPLLIGICGAAMYYTKGFGFAFFTVAFTAVYAYKFFTKEIGKKELASTLLKGYGIFLLLCAPWIYAISKSEHTFTISSAGSNALNIINPAINPDPFDDIHYPFEKGILYEPPPHAVSAWLYQHRLIETGWSPFASSQDFNHYLKMIWRNVLSVRSYHFGIDAGTVLVLVLILLLASRKAGLKNLLRENAFLLIACLICTLLYVLLMTIHRYLWINDIAIIILFSSAVQKLFEWKRWMGFTALTIFIFLVIYPSLKSIEESAGDGSEIYYDCKGLKDYNHITGKVISLIDNFPDRNHRLSNLVCYYTGTYYYGMAGEHNLPEIEKEKIDYVLDWRHTRDNWLEKNNMVGEVISFSGGYLTVYKLRHLPPRRD